MRWRLHGMGIQCMSVDAVLWVTVLLPLLLGLLFLFSLLLSLLLLLHRCFAVASAVAFSCCDFSCCFDCFCWCCHCCGCCFCCCCYRCCLCKRTSVSCPLHGKWLSASGAALSLSLSFPLRLSTSLFLRNTRFSLRCPGLTPHGLSSDA